jgi:predicted amidohydrolase YtcJ
MLTPFGERRGQRSSGLCLALAACENGLPRQGWRLAKQHNRNDMRTATVITGWVLAALGGAAASPAQDVADLVLRHATLYPVTAAPVTDGALAVRGGRLVYVGPDAGVAAWSGPRTQVIDLGGRAVTPGLIDAHSHLEGLGGALEQVVLTGTASYDEVVARVRAAAAELPPGSWVVGRGWDQNDWPASAEGDKPMPLHAALSAAVPEHPVWITRVDGHAALLNARALTALGIEEAVADPPGGRFLRDARGRLSGVLVDAAMAVAGAERPASSPADLHRRILRGARESLRYGLTGVTDMGVDPATATAYRALQAKGELPLRVALFWDGERPDLAELLAPGPWSSDDRRLLLRGVKLYADGALGSRGAALLEPYADEGGNLGLVVIPGDRLADISRLAVGRGFQVGIHAIGDRGNLLAVDALESALGGPRPQARCRIEHVQIVRADDLARMGRLGIIGSMQPTHATSDMPWVPARLGPHRLDRAYPWRRALDSGVRLALGSDFPVESVDPLLGIYAAVTRQDTGGAPAGGWLPDQRLTREEALRGFTLDAAWSLFLDDQVGSLEAGKRADLVVWERDPMQVPAAEIPSVRVDLTLVDGSVAYRREGAP